MIKNLGELISAIGTFKGVTDDSRIVQPGFIFVAVKGIKSDGHDFIPRAIQKGAAAVVGEKGQTYGNIPYIKVDDSREALGVLASAWYGNPSMKLKIIGVTGTKGKTTTCHIIYHILKTLGKKAGLMSSISVPGLHVTSPDVVYLHRTLKEFVDAGDNYVVIEVSSHGIDQKRIAGVKFDIGVLTHIAPEHLDYHKTFEQYRKTKTSFINSCKEQVISPTDTDLTILPGKYNNLNIEAAIAAVGKLGVKRNDAINAVKTFKLPEGRLREIPNALGIKIYIDFAHTPDSLEAVLTYLKNETKGELIAVFGCAGERDPGKRFPMGRISAQLADISVLTAEDPRSENIFTILSKMAKGAKAAGAVEGRDFMRIPERGEAMAFALSICQKGDTVAFLGKGHEKSMNYGGFEHPWSDKEMINDLLNPIKDISAIIMAAGLGTRMNSEVPKVLHEIAGRAMIALTLENLRRLGIADVVVVVGYKKELVMEKVGGMVSFAEQANPKGGTADSVKTGLAKVNPQSKYVLALYGDDSAFFKPETTKKVIVEHIKNKAVVSFVSAEVKNPYGLGRILRNATGDILGIVEEKNAGEKEKLINEINCGHFVFNKTWVDENISKTKPSPSGEYYINDVIKLAIDQHKKVCVYKLPDPSEWQGVNTPEELEKAEIKMEEKLENYNE